MMGKCMNCGSLLDYIYGIWWKCRRCSHWEPHVPGEIASTGTYGSP